MEICKLARGFIYYFSNKWEEAELNYRPKKRMPARRDSWKNKEDLNIYSDRK